MSRDAVNHTSVEAALRELSELVTAGRTTLGCDGVCLHLLDASRRNILLQVVSSGYIAGPTTQFMTLEESPAVADSIAGPVRIVVDDALRDPRVARRAIERFKIRACVYAPLVGDGVGEGVLIPSYRAAHAWATAQLASIDALAGRCAGALRPRGTRRSVADSVG